MRQKNDYYIHKRHPLLQGEHQSRKENYFFKSLHKNKIRDTEKVFSKDYQKSIHEVKSGK